VSTFQSYKQEYNNIACSGIYAACRRQGSGAHVFGSWLADEVRNTNRGEKIQTGALPAVINFSINQTKPNFNCN